MTAFGGTWKTTSGSGVRLPPPKTTMFRTGQSQAKQPSPTGTAYRAAAAPASGGAYASSGEIDNNAFAQAAPAAQADVSNSNRGYAAPPAPSPPPNKTMFRTGQAQAKQPSPTGTAYRAPAAPASGGAYASSMDKPAPPAPAAPNNNRGYAAPPAPSPPPMFPMPASFEYQTNGQNRTYNAPSYSADAPNAEDYVPHIMPGGVMSRASIMRDATPQQLQGQLSSMMQDYRNEQNDYNKLNKRQFRRPPTIEDARREYGARAQLSTPTG